MPPDSDRETEGAGSNPLRICTFEWREEFLTEENESNQKRNQCPIINIKLQDIEVQALVDSGSQISCVSEEFLKKHMEKFKRCPILPLVNSSAVGATGGKPIKIKQQIFVQISVNNCRFEQILLIVPSLTRDCILGIDLLREQKGIMNFREDKLQIKPEDIEYQIPLTIEYNNCLNLNEMNLTYDVELKPEAIRLKIEENELIEENRREAYID